jgi:hypothetical protein
MERGYGKTTRVNKHHTIRVYQYQFVGLYVVRQQHGQYQ